MDIYDAVKYSFSQAMQDVFAFYVNEFREKGYFLDFGANEPFKYNNTALLERHGWTGLLVDRAADLVAFCKAYRKSQAVCVDLTKVNVNDLLSLYQTPSLVDYMSMDLDDNAAWQVIQAFDFNKYKVRCITYEHDAYDKGNDVRDLSREFLKSKGFELVCADVTIFSGSSFEDWYVDPSLTNPEVVSNIKCSGKEYNQIFSPLF